MSRLEEGLTGTIKRLKSASLEATEFVAQQFISGEKDGLLTRPLAKVPRSNLPGSLRRDNA